ncbi:MAG: hypothetical protein A2854_03360 [Parcubacteria group bacterium RIFCSPHIGHO2_01_FULL_56_18]|nr:MAG: hypothetical protein A2854_03360 [Parcubacteria group bacterium RIFCSPHIGHO2_01_FULL_56_18]
MNEKSGSKQYFSTSDVAKIMGISRIAVFKKIKNGQIKAEKIGRNYVVSKINLENALGTSVSVEQKTEIQNIVKKAVREYNVAFRRLGKEE